jgi:hypothetical protein
VRAASKVTAVFVFFSRNFTFNNKIHNSIAKIISDKRLPIVLRNSSDTFLKKASRKFRIVHWLYKTVFQPPVQRNEQISKIDIGLI